MMKIIRARIRGLGDTMETAWFDLSPRLNLLLISEEKARSAFLQALETVNPLLPCEKTRPFADFPLVSRRQGYNRRIFPEKRTVALAIFNTSPDLVAELAAVSPHLYETDRIEVGRRLDYSRWLNFVEIASSTRWGEIAGEMAQLSELTRRNAPEAAANPTTLTQALQHSDRIKNGLARELADWLQALPAGIRESERQRIDRLTAAINRASDFQRARRLIAERLPLLIAPDDALAPILDRINGRVEELGGPSAASSRYFCEDINRHLKENRTFTSLSLRLDLRESGVSLTTRPLLAPADPESALSALQATVSLALAFSRITRRAEPILLFDCPERHLPGQLHRQLADFILSLAEFCQCCHASATGDIFSRQKNLPRYTVAELTGN